MSCGSHVFPVILQWFSPLDQDVIPARKTGLETLLAVKRALLKSESLTQKSAVQKKIQDVDKAQGAGRRAQLLKLMGGVILMVNLSHG